MRNKLGTGVRLSVVSVKGASIDDFSPKLIRDSEMSIHLEADGTYTVRDAAGVVLFVSPTYLDALSWLRRLPLWLCEDG